METVEAFTVDYLKDNHFDVEQVIELLNVYANAENVEEYKEHIEVLADKYDADFNMGTEVMSLPMVLLRAQRHEQITQEALRNVFWLTDKDYATLLLALLYEYQTDPEVLKYLEVLNETFRMEPTKENMEELLSLIRLSELDENVGAALLKSYVEAQLGKLSGVAPRPEYMSQKQVDRDSIPVLTPLLKTKNPNRINARFMVNQGLTTAAFSIELPPGDPVVELTRVLDGMSKQEKRELFDSYNSLKESFITAISYNADAIRVFGPVCPEDGFEVDELNDEYMKPKSERDINVVYGGPRMFHDVSREVDDSGHVALTSWFTGTCEECFKEIEFYRYAVRRPLLRGGWVGCFCSFDCVQTSISAYYLSMKSAENNTSEDKELDDSLELEQELVKQMNAIVNEVGIEDVVTEIEYDLESSDEE